MKSFAVLCLLVISNSAFAFGGRQIPPDDIGTSWRANARIRCEEGTVLGILPMESHAEVDMVVANPHVKDHYYRSVAYNLLNIGNRPYSETPKYVQVGANGAVSVRADTDQEFFPLGTIAEADIQAACGESTSEAIRARCEDNERCIQAMKDAYARGMETTLPLHVRPDLQLSLERSTPKCVNKWMHLDPETSREYDVYLTLSAAGRSMEFTMPGGELTASGKACREFEDGWKEKP